VANEVDQQFSKKGSVLSIGWIILAILLPIAGFVVGIVFAIQGREGAGSLIAVSFAAWLGYFLFLIV